MSCDCNEITYLTKGEKGDRGDLGLTGPQGLQGVPGINGWILDGNTEGSEKYFGTNDNYSIPIYTNGIARGIFGNNGDFAFGSSSLLANTRVYIKGINSVNTDNALVVGNSSGVFAVFRNDGNVGIAASVPTARLQIDDDALVVRDIFHIRSAYYNQEYFRINSTGNSAGVRITSDFGYWGLGTAAVLGSVRLALKGNGTSNGTSTIEAQNSSGTLTFIVSDSGTLSVNTTNQTSKLNVGGLTTHVDNAAAITAGLTAGAFYVRTGHGLDIVV
jgi:hypothetical protein